MSKSNEDQPTRGASARLLALILLALSAPAFAGEINSCKYLVVTDFASDPFGIAEELREQASAKGFAVVTAISDLSATDILKACVMSGSWWRTLNGGRLSMRVVDAPSGALIAEANSGAGRFGVGPTRRALVAKIYSQLEYTGFNEDLNRQRIQREYPARPKIAITEEDIKTRESRSNVEGIWTDTQDQYRLGIVAAPEGSDSDYVAVVLRSNSPLWQPGEIKGEIRGTASPNVFTCTCFMGNKRPAGTTLTLDNGSILRGSVATPQGSKDLLLLRVWPKTADESAGTPSPKGGASGTAFLISRSGLVATNWHVVAEGKNFSVAFPNWSSAVSAEVVIKDVVNDLAILRMTDTTKLVTTCPDLPFQLTSSNGVKLGERVATIGYPLTSMLGSNPKFSEGNVSSKSGLNDDPTRFQISAQIQPGSSGSPLFDSEGNVVGIVVSTLNPARAIQEAGSLPQNVNYAIKADYLLSLVSMLSANDAPASRTIAFSAEKAAPCVAIIRAW